jgi:hypothetical protein
MWNIFGFIHSDTAYSDLGKVDQLNVKDFESNVRILSAPDLVPDGVGSRSSDAHA